MTRKEFAQIVAYVATAIDKELPKDRIAVYFDLLGDLPFEVLISAAKKVVLEHPWATFPSAAELRQAASETMRGKVTDLSPAEAWEIAWRVAGKTDPESEGSFSRATKDVPAIIVEAIKAYGVNSLCYGKEPVAVVRRQFIEIYQQIAAREKRAALLPAKLKKTIEEGPSKPLPPKVLKAIEGIGKEEAAR